MFFGEFVDREQRNANQRPLGPSFPLVDTLSDGSLALEECDPSTTLPLPIPGSSMVEHSAVNFHTNR